MRKERSPPANDGAWHQRTGQWSPVIAAQSVQIFLNVYCVAQVGGICNAPSVARFDDVFLDVHALAVKVASLTATRTRSGVLMRWRTASETETLGFHVYRFTGSRYMRVTKALIAAHGGVAGSAYSYLDRLAPRGKHALRYRLQSVQLDGSRSWVGRPFAVRR